MRCVRLRIPASAPAPKPSPLLIARSPKKIGVFCHGFAAMTAVTQALQFTVQEQLDITAMWNHMVNIGRSDSVSKPGTFTAERLAGQLSFSPSFPAKAWVRVQVMPGC